MTRFSEALCQELGRDQHILLYCLTRLRSPAPIFSTWRERSSTPIRLTFIGADEGLVSALLWGYPRCFWTVVLEKTLESPLDCKEIQPVHPEGDQPWGFFGRNDAKAETSVLWPPQAKSWLIRKKFWCWEGLGAGGEGDDRGWSSWMASLTQWTWGWVNSGSWWWTGRPGVLRFMGSQTVAKSQTRLSDWTELKHHQGMVPGWVSLRTDISLVPESAVPYMETWKWTEIILLFLRLHSNTAFQTLVDYEGYSISSKGLLPTVVYIMVIQIKFSHSGPFFFTDS